MIMNSLPLTNSRFDIDAIRRQFPILRESPEAVPLHYLDSASTAQIPQLVVEALVEHELHNRANVQRGAYRLADRATDAYQSARHTAARYINAADADEVVFTAGTTAALNLLACCLGADLQPGDEILLSELEHHSNLLPWREMAKLRGAVVRYIPVKADGRLDLSALPALLSTRTRIVSVSHCSNVTGVITDVDSIVAAARSVEALVVLDGAQFAPHGPFDVQALGVDFYAFSGHKCYGPNAVGVLWGRRDRWQNLPPYMTGGGMVDRVEAESQSYASGPRRFEAGTPPIAQAVGLAAALDWLMALPWVEIEQHTDALLERLYRGLSNIPQVQLISPDSGADRHPVVSFQIPGIHAHDLSHVLNERGVAVRGGAHCAELLMQALGCDTTIRASIGVYNNEQDIDQLIAGVGDAVRILG
ncbi:MAG: cysteine desulfurase [Halopseudomonas sp.]